MRLPIPDLKVTCEFKRESRMAKFREEALKVTLAEILSNYGVIANPEIIVTKKLADFRIVIGGLKVILKRKTA